MLNRWLSIATDWHYWLGYAAGWSGCYFQRMFARRDLALKGTRPPGLEYGRPGFIAHGQQPKRTPPA